MIDISIIIPSYNSGESLAEALQYLQNQKTKVQFEIIIVDSSPSDDVDKLCADYEKIKLIKLKTKTLPGAARNIGAKNALGKLILFCDSDVLLKEDAITQAWKYYTAGNNAFGGALELAKGSSIPVGLLEHYFFNHESQSLRPISDRKNLSSALMLIDRDLFDKFNGFKNIPRMQDTELTERIINNGNSLKFYPGVLGYQRQITSWKGLKRKVFLCGHNLFFIRYFDKNEVFKKIILRVGLPIIAFMKMSRINFRNVRYSRGKNRLKTLLWTPALYYLGIIWMAGFYNGINKNDGISNDR